jgi:hypothetical protein
VDGGANATTSRHYYLVMPDLVTVTTARVYGSASRYGEPHESPGGPFNLPHFPTGSHRAEIALGSRPDWIFRANLVGRAIGIAALDRTLGGLAPGMTVPERTHEALAELEAVVDTIDFQWYVTIAVARDYESLSLRDGEYLWTDISQGFAIEREERELAAPAIDAIAAALVPALGEQFFEEIALPDHTYFSASGRQPFRLPRTHVSANLSVGVSMSRLDGTKVERALSFVRRTSRSMRALNHWRVAALTERDPWKRFDWTFLAVEVLVNRLAVPCQRRLVADLRRHGSEGEWAVPPELLPIARMALVEKFVVVAMALRPSQAQEDVQKFMLAKKARDGMSHGAVTNPESLPVNEATALLNTYWEAFVDSR